MTTCSRGRNFGCELQPLKLLKSSKAHVASPATRCFIPQSVFRLLLSSLCCVYGRWRAEDREESFVIFTMQSTSSASPTASQHYTMVIGSYALLRVCHNNSERRQGPLSVCCCSMGCRKPVSFRFQNILTHARATHTEIWKAFRSCVCGGRVWGY